MNSEEGPDTLQSCQGNLIVVRQSSVKETPQPCLSNEPCGKLRRRGFDETNISTGASLEDA